MNFNPLLSQFPSPSTKRIALRITPPAERALRQGRPWIFDQSIAAQSHAGAPGDLAVIFDDKRRFLAVGLYDSTSFAAIHQAAKESNRPLKEIERAGHALDHPVKFKEGAYLKCLFARA
ncbi:MAG: hypothetical protein Fur002_15020 [Anaerolineales bacterium]